MSSNSGTIYSVAKLTQLDPGQIVRDTHDFYGNASRVLDSRSVVPSYYSHFRAEYNNDNNPTKVTYYHGLTAHLTEFTSLMATSLAGKYFTLRSAPDNAKRVIWFSLDGVGTAPVVSGAESYIEVPLDSSDAGAITAVSIRLTLNALSGGLFKVQTNGAKVSIRTTGFGIVEDSEVKNSGFIFNQVSGTQETVAEVVIPYIAENPFFEGEILKGYGFDIYSGKFVKNAKVTVGNIVITDQDGDKLQINTDGSLNVNVVSTAQVLKSYFSEVTGVATGITEVVCTYTATAPVYLQKIEFSGTNIATFELYVAGIIVDRKITYFSGNLGGVFEFNQGLNIATGQVIEVRVYHNRPDPGNFSTRMQILESGA